MTRESQIGSIQSRISGDAHSPYAAKIYDEFQPNMAARVRAVNEANGWHDSARTFGEGIALIHSEASEALEAYRAHGLDDMTDRGLCPAMCKHGFRQCPLPKPEGVGSEFADILIRLLDEADRQGVDLMFEFDRKLAYNATRGYRHGDKRI